jgi:hypothetical protein
MNKARQNFPSRHPYLAIAVLLLSLFSFLAITVPVAAQDPMEARVKTSLEELKNAITKAKEILAAFENRQARELVMKAEALHREAESKYNQALNTNAPRLRELYLKEALANIALAKSHLDRAFNLSLDLPLTRLRSTLGELMRRAEQSIVGQGNREAQRLVYQARKAQLEAERAVLRQEPRRAYEQYQIAIALVEKALSLVEGRKLAPEAAPETALSREKERYENLAGRAREAVETGKNSAALLVLEQARKQALAAEEAFRRGELVLAQRLYRGATRLLLRAFNLAMAGQKGADWGRNEIALLQELIQTAEQEVNENADPRASLFLQRARVLASEAEAALAQQQPQEAKWRIEMARNFVDKAMRKADRSAVTPENVAQRYDEALQELAGDIEEVGAKTRDAGNADVQQLVEMAANAYQAAENAGRQKRLGIGFQLIRLAQHFLLRAETLLRDSAAPNAANAPTRDAVLQRLTMVENALPQLSSEGGPESCETIRTQVAELIKRSRAALDRGQIRLALVIIEVANDLMENCLQK